MTLGVRGAGLLVGALCLLALGAGAGAPASVAARSNGPFLTLLFSRTAVTAAQECVADDIGVARLDTVVAPALRARALAVTGTVETGPTRSTSLWCGHSGSTLYVSWSLAGRLARDDGWTFVSHSATYPDSDAAWSALTPAELDAETCGSRQALAGHGLPGASGLFAWPKNYVYEPALPAVERCFDFNRPGGVTWVSDRATVTQPPYSAPMRPLDGGHCDDKSAPCFGYVFPHAKARYTPPASVVAMLRALVPGQWTTIQAYLLVTGARAGRWDCTSADPEEHWTDDTERYCWSDYLSIVSAIPASVVVTDPASVGAAWGRVVP